MEYSGIIVGAALFASITIGRWACIKGEYYFTKRIWIAFLLIGIGCVAASLFMNNLVLSSIFSIFGFVFLWGIGEVIEQEERVNKGWFPKRKK